MTAPPPRRPTVAFTGYVPGASTIGLIKLVRENTDLGLKAAKEAVEKVLEGQRVEFAVVDESQAAVFTEQARGLGALVDHAASD